MSGSTARTINIRIAVQDDEARRKLEQIGKNGAVSLQQIERAASSASPAVQNLAGVSDGLAGALGRVGVTAPIGGGAVASLAASATLAATAIARAGDQYTQTMAQLTAATGSAAAAGSVLTELQRLAQQTGVSVGESAGAFSRFSIAAREVGATNAEVLSLVRTIQQAGIIAGSSTQETQAAVLQLGQALASGRLQGDELRSILENMPNLAAALAGELGVTVGQLRQMGAEGKLTADTVLPALLRAGERINQEFGAMPDTISRSFGALREATNGFLAQLDQALGLSQRIAGVLQVAAERIRAAQVRLAGLPEAEQAAATEATARGNLERLRAEMARLEAEAPAAARRGSLRPALQEAAGQAAERQERLARLREEAAEQEKVIRDAGERRNAIERAAREVEEAEQATAAARRNASARRQATERFNEVRGSLDRERKLREEHQTRLEAIDAGERAGATDAAEAARLRTLANRELEDGLKRLEPATRAASGARREANDNEREAQSLMEEGRRVTESVRTEQERYAAEQDRLNRLLERGAITRETYNRALERADPATRRAAEEARALQQQAERDAERQRQAADQFVARYSADLARGTADALFDGFEKGKGFGDSMAQAFRRSLRTAATSALDAIVFRPIMQMGANAMGFGTPYQNLPSIWGGSGSITGTVVPDGNGGWMQVAGTASNASSLWRSITSFNPGQYMSPGYGWNTGWGWADSVLNTSVWGSSYAGQAAATNSALAGMGGSYGPATQSAVTAAGGSAGSMSLGSVAAGAAGVAAGGYGVYSGIQRGGIGGYTSAAGSALTTALSAASMVGMNFGPPGWIAAAILQIVGALLPGAKPSSGSAAANINTSTGEVRYDSNRRNFSQANQDEAERVARSIANLETEMEKKLGFGLGIEVGVGADSARRGDPANYFLKVGESRRAEFSRDEKGAQELAQTAARFLLETFQDEARKQGKTDDKSKVLLASRSVEEFDANMQWFEQVYQVMTDTAEKTSVFAEQLKGLIAPYDAAIKKAGELGLATETLTKKRDEEMDRALAPLLNKEEEVVDAYEKQLEAITEEYEAAIKAAKELGRATEDLEEAMSKAAETLKEEMQDSFDQQMRATKGEGYIDQIGALRDSLIANLETYESIGRDGYALYRAQLENLFKNMNEDQLNAVIEYYKGIDDMVVALAEYAKQELNSFEKKMRAAKGEGYIDDVEGARKELTQNLETYEGTGNDSYALYRAQLESLFKNMNEEQLDKIIEYYEGVDEMVVALAKSAKDQLDAAEKQQDAAEAQEKAAAERDQGASDAVSTVRSLRSYVTGLSTSDASAGTALDRYEAAQRQFSAVAGAAAAGDANSIAALEGVAETFRSLSREVYGGGASYVSDLDRITAAISAVADRGAEALTQDFMKENAKENTDRLVDELQKLRDENAKLRKDFNVLSAQIVALAA